MLQVYFCDRSFQAVQQEDSGFEASQQRPCIKKGRQKKKTSRKYRDYFFLIPILPSMCWDLSKCNPLIASLCLVK